MIKSELSFLLELLLEGRLQRVWKDKVRERIGQIEENMSLPQAIAVHRREQSVVQQSMPPVDAVAQTAAVAQALANRQAAITASLSDKPEKGRTSPRKF